MDPKRARALLAAERERIERALGQLSHQDTGEPAEEDPAALGSDPAAIADPSDRTNVFAWKLTLTEDPFGNRIEYEYERVCEGTTEPGRLRPDFSFISPDGDVIVWEHLGMVNLKNAFWRRVSGPEAEDVAWRPYWTSGRQGLASWPRVAAELNRRGYRGTVCLTAEYSDEAAVERLVAADLAYARELFGAISRPS